MRRLLLACLVLASCGPADQGDAGLPPDFTGTVEPGASASLAALVAQVAGPAPVAYSIDPGGGSITAAGVYTAPSCAQIIAALPPGTDLTTAGPITGTDTVHASWAGGSLDIAITISEGYREPRLTVEPADPDLPPGGTTQFVAWWHFTCHDARAP